MAGLVLLIILIAVLTVGAAVVVLAVLFGKAAQQRRLEQMAPLLRADALVVDKRSEITGGGETVASQHYYVTFEFPDGNRAELSVSGAESGMLTPGDRGLLEWQGSRFVGFARQILR